MARLESMGFGVLLLVSANAVGGLTLHAACGARKEPWLSSGPNQQN